MTTFLLRAPPALFSSCTQAQALKVLAFLKRDLGVKQEYLFPRIVCAAPGVLLQVCAGIDHMRTVLHATNRHVCPYHRAIAYHRQAGKSIRPYSMEKSPPQWLRHLLIARKRGRERDRD